MSTPTTREELDAVNQILASVGQAPVTAFDQNGDEIELTQPTNPDVAIAYNTLTQVSREVQSEGWTFNKEYSVIIPLTENNEALIPDSVLQLSLSDNVVYNRSHKGVLRTDTKDGLKKLWDRVDHTFEWAQDLICDVMYLYPFQDLPTPIRGYIVAKAATMTSQRIVGDTNLYQMLAQFEAQQRAVALQYETTQGTFSMFGTPEAADYYVEYKPIHTLRR